MTDGWMDVALTGFVLGYLAPTVAGLGKLYLIGVVFFFVERLRPAVRGQRFFKADFLTELAYPVFNAAVTAPLFGFVSAYLALHVFGTYLPERIFAGTLEAAPFVMQVLFVMFVADVAIWVEHWIAHKLLWNYHALHHMTPEVSWLTHARVHPVNGLTIALAGLLAQTVFGLDGAAAAVGSAIVVGISVWEHANLDFAWPRPLCWLLVSPRFHRWHHSSAPEAIDRNFCLVFPFIDLVMGTYYCPDRMPTAYGVHRTAADPAPIPDGFFAQLCHPFRLTVATTRARLFGAGIRIAPGSEGP